MHAAKHLDRPRRNHRLHFVTCQPLSDCCGAPILKGGICFECRESCVDADRRRSCWSWLPSGRRTALVRAEAIEV